MSGSGGGGANGTEFRTGREADEEEKEGQEVTGCQDSGCGPSGEAGARAKWREVGRLQLLEWPQAAEQDGSHRPKALTARPCLFRKS